MRRTAAVFLAAALVAGAAAAQDNYEGNDTIGAAYDLTGWDGGWLLALNGYGEISSSGDEDWFEIYVTPNYENLYVWCVFAHASGDIDIALYDDVGNLVDYSDSMTDDEEIDIIVVPPGGGTYYVQIYSAFGDTNTYDLYWESLATPDDGYEENDLSTSATDLTVSGYDSEGYWLSDVEYGYLWDDDWYEIYVSPGYERVIIDCEFINADGDIDIELYDDVGDPVDYADSTTDNEQIDCEVAGSGYYYICVYSDFVEQGTGYDLIWETFAPGGDITVVCTPSSARGGVAGALVSLALLAGAAVALMRRRVNA